MRVRFGAHSYGQCQAIRSRGMHRGWFATGNNVPEAGTVRWTRTAWLRAFLDSILLAWRHRKPSDAASSPSRPFQGVDTNQEGRQQ